VTFVFIRICFFRASYRLYLTLSCQYYPYIWPGSQTPHGLPIPSSARWQVFGRYGQVRHLYGLSVRPRINLPELSGRRIENPVPIKIHPPASMFIGDRFIFSHDTRLRQYRMAIRILLGSPGMLGTAAPLLIKDKPGNPGFFMQIYGK
jgi:hypothetical protein